MAITLNSESDGYRSISCGEYSGKVTVEYVPEANYAMVHNHIPVLGYVELTNDSSIDWNDVVLEIKGEHVVSSIVAVPFIERGVQVQIKELSVVPDASYLVSLTESIGTKFTLSVMVGDEEIFHSDYGLALKAFNQWSGTNVRPEVLSAFVTPNHPLITEVLNQTAIELKNLTGNSSLDGYLSQNYDRARSIVAALFIALKKQNLIYAVPPASYGKGGQRIRLADEVLTGKVGTCLDLSLLMASCLEAMGMNPLIVLFRTHALVGCWLSDEMSANMVMDDQSFLTKATAAGISRMVLVESTRLTDNTSFESAAAEAESTVRASEVEDATQKFDMYVDVAKCRLEHILPLPQRVLTDAGWNIVAPGEEHLTGDTKVNATYTYEDPKQVEKELTKQDLWERKLLDMTMSNRLLKMVPGARLVQFWSYNIDKVEDVLRSGDELKMIACYDDCTERGVHDTQVLFPDHKEAITKELDSKRLISYLNGQELESSLKNINRLARSSMEENGANSLFIALGALRFFEDEFSQKPCYAPLLLLPVNLVRKGGFLSYVIRGRDEDTMFNTTLREYLRQTFKIDIKGVDPLPKDEHGVDVKQILAMVRKSIADQPRWNVLDECFLGIFSFSKFVMWNDIHYNADKLRENKVVSSLLSGKLEWIDEAKQADARQADKTHKPADFAIPVDADSSQLEAIIESGEGKSFILHGPPGTGKSQTITNIIANALYHGKRVLFVAEKMAALEVVQSRLEKIGIAPFCLELHSNTATKAHVLKQFDEVLNVKHIVPADKFEKSSEDLFQRRQELISYLDALHTRAANGLSVYDCITRYLSLSGDKMQLPNEVIASLNDQLISETVEEIKDLDTILSVVGNPGKNPLYGLDVYDCSSEVRNSLERGLSDLSQKIAGVIPVMNDFASSTGERIEDSIIGIKHMHLGLSMLNEYYSQKNQLIQRYSSSLLDEDPTRLKNEWDRINKQGFIHKLFATNRFVKSLRRYDSTLKKSGINNLISALEAYKQKDASTPERLKRIGEQTVASSIAAVTSLLSSLQSLEGVCSFDKNVNPFCLAMQGNIGRWLSGLDGLKNWYLWCSKTKSIKDKGLSMLIDKMASQNLSPEKTAALFQKSVYYRLAQDGINDSPALRQFNGLLFEDVITKYRALATEFMEMTRHELFHKLASNVPYQPNEIVGSSEIGLLKRNISSGGRGTSIRKLMDQIPTLLPKLCPCMLMSPISVAQYISLDSPKFDIVIFDEASQMPTSEAVGAIARGKSLIVVGDPKQMPPTDFFQKTAVSEEEYYLDDMESILDDCISLSIPSRHITWHYRSRHESLIAFSNSQYYEGKLFTFPSVDDRQSKVTLVPVKGVYLKGGTNKTEAKAIVDEIVSRLKNPSLRKYSIGVVSFNKKQQLLIEDMLMDVLDADSELKKAAFDTHEPIFIKNLENVQGDERDVILFSVGYGPDASGKVSMNFGPLNQHGGQRRLNVAVSRSRYEMKVFSMLTSGDIDLRRTHAEGVVGLKNFLEYAQTGTVLAGKSQTEKMEENAIINQIAERLRAKELEVDTRVGRSNFRIDLAIADIKDPTKYVLGILCDGENYYGTKTERDREIVQPSVLNRLGWNIMKVWAMDWFENSDKVIDSIIKKLDQIYEAKNSVIPTEPEPVVPAVRASFCAAELPEESTRGRNKEKNYEAAEVAKEDPTTADHAFIDCRRKSINQIKKIVKVESPINSTLLYRRLREIWGITRMTAQAKEKVDVLLDDCGIYQSIETDGFVLWNSKEEADAFDAYRVGEGRNDVTEIPVVELSIAMKQIVQEQLGISREDLFHFTAFRFGITRAGSNVDIRCSSALALLERDCAVQEKDGKITLA